MKRFNSLVVALMAAFVLSVLAPAIAKTPAPGASPAPAAKKADKAPAAKKAERAQTVEGKVVKYTDTELVIQAKNNKTMEFTHTKAGVKGFSQVGTPAVGKTVKVWYKSDKTASKVQVLADKTDKPATKKTDKPATKKTDKPAGTK